MTEEMTKGWVKLHRKFKDCWLWKQRRRFSKWEAWEDLFTEANYKENKVPKGNSLIVVKRGQLLTSQIKLAKRWRWHRETVSNFLKLLKSDGMLDITTVKGYDIGYTLITILNYSELQNNDVDTSDITSSIGLQHYSDISASNNNNSKERKEHISNYPSLVEKYISLKAYNKETLQKNDYVRIGNALKGLVLKAGNNPELIGEAMEWISRQGYDWTLETLIKKWPDFLKAKEEEKSDPAHQELK